MLLIFLLWDGGDVGVERLVVLLVLLGATVGVMDLWVGVGAAELVALTVLLGAEVVDVVGKLVVTDKGLVEVTGAIAVLAAVPDAVVEIVFAASNDESAAISLEEAELAEDVMDNMGCVVMPPAPALLRVPAEEVNNASSICTSKPTNPIFPLTALALAPVPPVLIIEAPLRPLPTMELVKEVPTFP